MSRNAARLAAGGGNRLILLKEYASRFASLPFADILKSYHTIEKQILDDVYTDISNFLIHEGYTLGGGEKNSFQKRTEMVVATLEFLGPGRTLIVCLQNVLKKHVNKASTVMLKSFGLVHRIEIRYHDSLEADIGLLKTLVSDRFLVAYECLETAFVRASADFTDKAYRGLYATLETALALSDRLRFFPKCRFAIADEETGFYYLDPTTVRAVVDLFKADQSDFMSPIELSIWLITSPFPFQKSVSIESVRRSFAPITLPFTANKYIHEAGQVVRATIELFGNEEYTVRALCQVRGFFLVIAIPGDHSQAVLPVVAGIEESLREQFENGISNCSPIIGTLKKASRGIPKLGVAEFVATVIAKFGAELAR